MRGIIRRASTFNTGWIDGIYPTRTRQKNKLFLHYGDLSDASWRSRR